MSHHHAAINMHRWSAVRRAVFKRDGWNQQTQHRDLTRRRLFGGRGSTAVRVDHEPALGVAERMHAALLAFHRQQILGLDIIAEVIDVRDIFVTGRVPQEEVVDSLPRITMRMPI